MNLENFPTDKTALRMLDMVSPIYDRSYVAKWVYQILGAELGKASDIALALLNEAYPETATYTLPWWAELYNVPISEGSSNDDIRKKILLKRNNRRPINPARIEQRISEITGREVIVNENTAPNVYEVVIMAGETMVDYDSVVSVIKEMKQSNKHVNIIFSDHHTVRIRADPNVPGFSYPYTIAGTKPDINTTGVITSCGLKADLETVAKMPAYKTAGESRALEKNKTTGNVAESAVYKACGSHTFRKG